MAVAVHLEAADQRQEQREGLWLQQINWVKSRLGLGNKNAWLRSLSLKFLIGAIKAHSVLVHCHQFLAVAGSPFQ